MALQAYLKQNAVAVVEWGHLNGVLGIFQKLLSSRANEAYAFQLLGTIVMNVRIIRAFLVSSRVRLLRSVVGPESVLT